MKSTFYAISRWVLILTLIINLGFAPARALATTASTQFAVSATVLSACIVLATDMLFNNYTSSSGTPLDTTSTVTVTCTVGTAYTVALNGGSGTGATVNARTMTNGTSTLSYGLYTNSNRTTVWGDGTNSTSTNGATAGLLPQPYTVYGRIPVNQYVSPGIYGDIVTATVTY